ncbi:MAG: hydroxyacid dehydrogenase [Actinobacteria bacterium]|nr:hydroxyacid dehydrogenase [Actinomycetota bacterium]
MQNNLIGLEPRQFDAYVDAIQTSGGLIANMGPDVEALVWTDYARPDLLEAMLEENPQLRFVQLPFAGVDAFSKIIAGHPQITFTSAKRSYSEPVAEHALMLCMALGRIIPERVRAKSWGKKHADSVFDAEVVIVGGGGIAQQLVDLLAPMRSLVTVIRKRPGEPFDNSQHSRVAGFDQLDESLARAQFVILACALTPETRFLFNAERFKLMRKDAYLVNVARGEIVNQEDLVQALKSGEIAACATDVTYPEPLPDDHEMWGVENLLITPHTADTMPIVTRLFALRLEENVTAWLTGGEPVGIVDPGLGY